MHDFSDMKHDLRYFAMFEGVGGFTKGIEEGYANWWNGRNRQTDIQLSERCEAVNGSGNNNSQAERQGGRIINGAYPACVGVSEIDRYASAIYKYHYPNHKNYGDATKLIPESIPDFDLLTGGFPCQAFSIAGKRQGFAEARGTLFFEIARILSHKRPRYFLLENVKGLLSHDSGKTYLTIIGILADLGYFVETVVLNSKDFGVPQNRERIFFIGHLAESGRSPRPILPFGQDGELSNDSGNADERRSQAKYSTSLKASGAVKADDTFIAEQARNPKKQDVTILSKDGSIKPKSIASTLTAGGNSGGNHSDMDLIQVVNVDTAGHNSLWGRVYSPEGLVSNLNANGGGMGAKTGLYVVKDGRHGERVYSDKGISPSLMSNAKGGTKQEAIMSSNKIRRLTPIECERLQKFEDRWTENGLITKKLVAKQDNGIFEIWKQLRTIKSENVQFRTVSDTNKQTSAIVSCTINGFSDTEQLAFPKNLSQCDINPVNIVIHKLENGARWECVISTTKCSDSTAIRFTWNKNENAQDQVGTFVSEMESASTGVLWNNILGDGFNQARLSIILTAIGSIIHSLISTFAHALNTRVCIGSAQFLSNKELQWNVLNLETDIITPMSDSVRYKCLGNAVTVSVIAWLVERILIHANNESD